MVAGGTSFFVFEHRTNLKNKKKTHFLVRAAEPHTPKMRTPIHFLDRHL